MLPRWSREARGLDWLTHVGGLAPLAWIGWDAAFGRLTANPVQDLTLRTGRAALILLLLGLAATPLSSLLGWRWALRPRRWLGLYAFLYAGLHLLIFVGLDYAFDPKLIVAGVLEKRYALAGLAAFAVLVPLALTSTRGWQKRLGKRWKTLHRAVYAAAALAVLHFIWLVKAGRVEPWWALGALAALLALRLPPVRAGLGRLRHLAARG